MATSVLIQPPPSPPPRVGALPSTTEAVQRIAVNAYVAGIDRARRIVEAQMRATWRAMHQDRALARDRRAALLTRRNADIDARADHHLLRALIALRRTLGEVAR